MKKNHEIKFKVSKEELEKIREKAKDMGLPIGTYCRSMSLIANPKSLNR